MASGIRSIRCTRPAHTDRLVCSSPPSPPSPHCALPRYRCSRCRGGASHRRHPVLSPTPRVIRVRIAGSRRPRVSTRRPRPPHPASCCARCCSVRPGNLEPMLNMAEGLARLGALAAHPVVATLADAFAAAGFELAVVGGPVRDAILGRPTHDLDFTTDARPDDILRVVKPISSTHWDIGRAFGTIGARVQGEQVEITTYRADSYDGVSRKPVVEFGDSIDGDLLRRDFTVNAMALQVPAVKLVDPTGGV